MATKKTAGEANLKDYLKKLAEIVSWFESQSELGKVLQDVTGNDDDGGCCAGCTTQQPSLLL